MVGKAGGRPVYPGDTVSNGVRAGAYMGRSGDGGVCSLERTDDRLGNGA